MKETHGFGLKQLSLKWKNHRYRTCEHEGTREKPDNKSPHSLNGALSEVSFVLLCESITGYTLGRR
jgi:hypothetical protein